MSKRGEGKRIGYDDIDSLRTTVCEGQGTVKRLEELLRRVRNGDVTTGRVGWPADYGRFVEGVDVPVSKRVAIKAIDQALYDAKIAYQLKLREFVSLLRAEEKALWS